MNKYTVTITDGKRKDRFTMDAFCYADAKRTAEIAHIGSGWTVENVSIEPQELKINF